MAEKEDTRTRKQKRKDAKKERKESKKQAQAQQKQPLSTSKFDTEKKTCPQQPQRQVQDQVKPPQQHHPPLKGEYRIPPGTLSYQEIIDGEDTRDEDDVIYGPHYKRLKELSMQIAPFCSAMTIKEWKSLATKPVKRALMEYTNLCVKAGVADRSARPAINAIFAAFSSDFWTTLEYKQKAYEMVARSCGMAHVRTKELMTELTTVWKCGENDEAALLRALWHGAGRPTETASLVGLRKSISELLYAFAYQAEAEAIAGIAGIDTWRNLSGRGRTFSQTGDRRSRSLAVADRYTGKDTAIPLRSRSLPEQLVASAADGLIDRAMLSSTLKKPPETSADSALNSGNVADDIVTSTIHDLPKPSSELLAVGMKVGSDGQVYLGPETSLDDLN